MRLRIRQDDRIADIVLGFFYGVILFFNIVCPDIADMLFVFQVIADYRIHTYDIFFEVPYLTIVFATFFTVGI